MKKAFPFFLAAAAVILISSCCRWQKTDCAVPVPRTSLRFVGFANDEIDTVWVYELVPGTQTVQDSSMVSGMSLSSYFEFNGESDLRINIPGAQRSYFVDAYTFACNECKNCKSSAPNRFCYVNGFNLDGVRVEGSDIVLTK